MPQAFFQDSTNAVFNCIFQNEIVYLNIVCLTNTICTANMLTDFRASCPCHMLLKQKARMDAAAKKKEEAKVLLEMEKNNKKANEVQVDEILSWASRFDDASYEAKHLVIAQLVDRIEIRKTDGYDITIHWRMTAEQFLGRKTEASA